jgi:hypothetical protein
MSLVEFPVIGDGGASSIGAGVGTSLDLSQYIKVGTGTPGHVDLAGGDAYITDDLEVDGDSWLEGVLYVANVRSSVSGTGQNRLTFSSALTKIESHDSANIQLLPNGSGLTQIGDAGSTSRGLDSNDDLFVSGEAEIDGALFCDGDFYPPLYQQDAEPTLSADNQIAIWEDTNDSDRVRLVYRRGSGDQVAVELT